MPAPPEPRRATHADAAEIGRLLHDFNTEYDDVTPGPAALAERVTELIAGGDTEVLLAGDRPVGLAVLRFRPSLWSLADECYLAELYVAPAERGHGLGDGLLRAAVDLARARGADFMDLGTSEDDVAARSLYEKHGFRRTEGEDGPTMYVYEREL